MNKILLLLFVTLVLSYKTFATVIYVNALATGNNDGSSWFNAFANLQDAIQFAEPGDSIWVAEGTYYPTIDENRYAYFELKQGVKWFGGFLGNETSFEERNWEDYPCVLSGDIGIEGDSTDNSYTIVYTAYTDSTTVMDGFVIAYGNADSEETGEPFRGPTKGGGGMYVMGAENNNQATPVIRNCTFRNNFARNYGGGLFLNGFNNGTASPSIELCTFKDNHAQFWGGGIYKGGGVYGDSAQLINYCLWQNNKALFGGGFYIHDTHGNRELIIQSCNFFGNRSTEGNAISVNDENDAGALILRNSEFSNNGAENTPSSTIEIFSQDTTSDLTVTDCIFEHNTFSSTAGISISFFSIQSGKKSIEINKTRFRNNSIVGGDILRLTGTFKLIVNNSLFYKNRLDDIGGVINLGNSNTIIDINNTGFINNRYGDVNSGVISFSSNGENRILNISNSIFWNNKKGNNSYENNINGEELVVNMQNSIIDFNNCDSIFNTELSTSVINCQNILYNQYPEFIDTTNGDFRLTPCSPAVNAGTNIVLDSTNLFDLDNAPRISEGIVDIGPYEVQAPLSVESVDIACPYDTGDATVNFNFSGAEQPLSYAWENENENGTGNSNLLTGSYQFTVTDANGCSRSIPVEIATPENLSVDFSVINASSAIASDGSITINSISGGTAPYIYLWSNGATTSSINNLSTGMYSLAVTDANECTYVYTIEVDFISSLSIQNSDTEFLVYPTLVQASRKIFLRANESFRGELDVVLIDAKGSHVFRRSLFIDQSGSAWIEVPKHSGVYFLILSSENKISTQKILVTD